MKLEKILDNLNSFEKNSFLKLIEGLRSNEPKNGKQIDQILNDVSGDLKAMDNLNISEVFSLLKSEFSDYLSKEFLNSTSQIGILSDILIRDGNCIMKQDWLSRLYDSELKQLHKKVKAFQAELKNDKSLLESNRFRDYQVFQACVNTAYTNDDLRNQERKITFDEQTILNTLSMELELSNEEIKLINYTIVPLERLNIENVINELKNLGIIFYSRKSNTIYVADEIVTIVRKLKGKKVGDKFFRRVLRQFREPQINLICKKHNIDWRLPLDSKIKEIINEGISFTGVLSNDIHKDETTLSEKKKIINDLVDNKLRVAQSIKGATIYDKINSLIDYFDAIEADEKVGISIDGYDKLLSELEEILPKTKDILRNEFELQEEKIMISSYLLDFNIKPRDVLEIISDSQLEKFCKKSEIKTRGDVVSNILEHFKDSENLYLENYVYVGRRDQNSLKENGLRIKDAELGLLFEDLTRRVLIKLGFTVNEKLRKQINTAKDKIDIVISMSDLEIIIVECKSVKDSGYNKFSSVSRQLKSYMKLAERNGLKVIKSLLVAPEFSDEFVKDCGLEYELNLSLITAESLIKILEEFKLCQLEVLPHNLLMRDVLIQEERIIKAISK